MNVRAAEVKVGDRLGDGFVVDGIFQAIGNRDALFAVGRSWGVVSSTRLLGFNADHLVTVR